MYDPITMKLNVDPYILSALKEDITCDNKLCHAGGKSRGSRSDL